MLKHLRVIVTLSLSVGYAAANCHERLSIELSDLVLGDDKPGYSYLVASNDEVLCSGSIGSKFEGAKDEIGLSTQFNLASVSKMFTGAAILQLISKGQLSLETSVIEILPELSETISAETKVKHLLNHSAALDSYLIDHPKSNSYGAYSYNALDSFERYNNETVLFLGSQAPIQHSEPGLKFEYNNTGYVFLALIVERVAGTSFEGFLEETFFKPLKMNNTEFASCDVNKYENLATDYFVEPNEYFHLDRRPYRCIHGPSNVLSTVEDMDKWLKSITTGKLFGVDTEAFLQSIPLDNGNDDGYGYGLMTAFFRGNPRYFHNGITFGYRTVAEVLPKQNVRIVILANRSDIDSIGLLNVLSEWLLESQFQ